jgi:DNA-directed RNA polymerase beta subunit
MTIPDFTRLQKKSFEFFTQMSCESDARNEQGLEKMLRALFPVKLRDGSQLNYDGYEVTPPSLTSWECVDLSRTFSAALRVCLRTNDEKSVDTEAIDLPLMTERGTFIINGVEKVVIGQLQAKEDTLHNDLTTRRLYMVGQQLQDTLAHALAEDVRTIAEDGEPGFPQFAQKLRTFFTNGPTARKANQTNPLALISHTRAVVQKGVSRRPGYEARDIQPSHFGRLCLLETPEGERIGINLTTAILADVDPEGRLLTPFRKQENGAFELLSPETESDRVLGDLGPGEGYEKRYYGGVLARSGGDICRTDPSKVEYTPVHPAQALGVSASLIPFVANDDSNRALMGANMQKQAVPLIAPEAPIVRTGLEGQVAADAHVTITADESGEVIEVTDENIIIRTQDGEVKHAELGVCSGHRPVVARGDRVSTGQVIADGPATDGGILALGQNVLVGYMPWKGYNFEDAIVVSDRLVRDNVFTSVRTREFTATITPSRNETIGSDHLEKNLCQNLTSDGLVREGTEVKGNDILIARRLDGTKDTSTRMPYGQGGTVVKVEHYCSENGYMLDNGVAELVRVTVTTRRDLKVGDKLCNRHGAKGVVGLIVPQAEMPILPDGRSLDVIMNPLGVPSRMNIGSILETHLGLAAHALNCNVVTPGFNGATIEDIEQLLEEAGLPKSGMLRLRDGRTGRSFDQETTVGYHYMMKLDHMVDDKCQARGTGPYAEDNQQPVQGRRHKGGLSIGIMETWALQAYGAANILQELLTIKSDDVTARVTARDALVNGEDLPQPTVPMSIKRLAARLRGLCLDLSVFRADGSEIDLAAPAASVDDIIAASLGFADAGRIVKSSAGKLKPAEGHDTFEDVFGEDDGLAAKHLELALPVRHAWQDRLGDGEEIPLITQLPILPPSLRGNRLNDEYMAVFAANETCRKSGSDGASLAGLQAAVDELVNGLTRMLHGKRGWITAAISGKRVDYCGRSVVCPGPDLDYDTCSLPVSMAATLLEPMVTGRMVREALAKSVQEAAELLRERDPKAMEILEREAQDRYVLLHRAPALHRLGIQAFRMKIADEAVIRIHPLTQTAFNADFDGDEMDVFLPLSDAAQTEARDLVRSSLGQVGPANGAYISTPSQDMVFGCYYATCLGKEAGNPVRTFDTLDSVSLSMDENGLAIHDVIEVGDRTTTVGRALFNSLLPATLQWVDEPVTKFLLRRLFKRCCEELGTGAAATLGDAVMRFGFRQATLSGVSLGKDTVKRYAGYEEDLAKAWQGVERLEEHWAIVDHWARATEQMARSAMKELAADQGGLNPVYMMATSGARGSQAQIRQLTVMRGLMAMPDGRIMSVPVTANFVHGLSPFEHLSSGFGARKGLSDTALKSANAGFLFKRVMSAVQDVMIVEDDCGTTEGVVKEAHPGGEHEWFPLYARIAGRTALEDIVLPSEDGPVVEAGETITAGAAVAIEEAGHRAIAVRSPVTCRSKRGVCAKCYGLDLVTGQPPRIGLAAGVIAAHSIGEPVSQLTMRTFHISPHSPADSKGGNTRMDIVGGMPRLDRLMEAWTRGDTGAEEHADLCELYDRAGAGAVAEFLLVEMQKVYRAQGVRVNDRHFEVVLSRMLADGSVKGVSQAATITDDFITAGSSRDGIDALAKIAANNRPVTLDAIRNCTAFGKQIPTVLG